MDLPSSSQSSSHNQSQQTISKERFYELKARAHSIDPLVRLGKNGISETVIINIQQLLRTRRLVKIKVLKNVLENMTMDELVSQVVSKTDSIVVDRIGLTFTLYKN